MITDEMTALAQEFLATHDWLSLHLSDDDAAQQTLDEMMSAEEFLRRADELCAPMDWSRAVGHLACLKLKANFEAKQALMVEEYIKEKWGVEL